MRKYRYLFIIFLLFISVRAFAKYDYINYHREIIAAEDLFLSNNYPGSISSYRRIFNKYPKAFLKDVFIATEIACLANDKENAMYFLNAAFQKGLNLKAVSMVRVIKNYLYNGEDQIRKVNAAYDIVRPAYLSSIDFDYRNRILVLMERDGLEKMIPSVWKTRQYRDSSYIKLLDDNLSELLSLINNRGFPSPNKIGVNDPSLDNTCEDVFYLYMCSFVDILFFHNRCTFQLLKEKCELAIHTGELDPRIYASMYEWSYIDFKEGKEHPWEKYMNKCICHVDSMKYSYNIYIHSPFFNSNTYFVDTCRRRIGMATIKHDEEKEQFERNHDVKLFFGTFDKY